MGYWHETCFISNLPIIGDGQVVALRTKTAGDIEFFMEQPYFCSMISIAKGILDPYGELENITDKHIGERLKNYKFNTDKGFIMFCYADLWQKLVAKSKEFFGSKIDEIAEINPNIKLSELEIEIICFSVFMYYARAGFPANLQRGSQRTNTSCRKFIAEITLEKVEEIEKLKEIDEF
jgi:hypothetical protein